MASIYSITRLAEHARELARAFDVTMQELPPFLVPHDMAFALPDRLLRQQFGMSIEGHFVLVQIISTEALYAIALHEMGHCLHPSGSVRTKDNQSSTGLKILEEESAWEWAGRYAIDWTVEMESVKVHALASYKELHARHLKSQFTPRGYETISDFLKRTKR